MKKINIDDIDLQDVYAFMEFGTAENAPEDIVRYLTLLSKIHGMHLRILQFGTKEHILKDLEITEGLSRYKADQLYNEMLEYYYQDINISKKVLINIYAEKLDNIITASTIIARTPEDFYRVTMMIEKVCKIRQLDIIDPPSFPKELLQKPNKVYAMDAAFLGEEKIDRSKLAKQIDDLDGYTVEEQLKLKEDAAIEPIILFKKNEQKG